MAMYDASMGWLRDQLAALGAGDTEDGGIYANKSGYHNTRAANDARWPGNYSVRDSVDRQGPADKAAGIDWTFRSAQRGDYTHIKLYCGRLWDASHAGDPRLAGWREWYGTCTGRTVQGYDIRRGRTVTSDNSHLWHIHFSESRNLVTSRANKKALLSVLNGESLTDWAARVGAVVPGVTTPVNPPAPIEDHLPGSRTLRLATPLMSGADVHYVQRWIGSRCGTPDGLYGAKTVAGVRWYQGMRGITVDGVCGQQTWHQMGV